METKINKIENLNQNELVELCVLIINKKYSSFERKSEKCLIATYNSPISSEEKHGFIVYTEIFSGKNNVMPIKEEIKKLAKKYSFNSIVIINSKNISNGFKNKFVGFEYPITWFDRDKIIEFLNKEQPNYWHHQDIDLLEYEKLFIENIKQENDLKRLKIFEKKYDKLINIFIEPRIYQILEDRESKFPTFKKTEINKIVNIEKPLVLSGDAGTGKTTTLKKIGEKLISLNANKSDKRKIPVFISSTDLIESNNQIANVVEKKLGKFFKLLFKDIIKSYEITLLIDSIDEFDNKTIELIISQLDKFYKLYSIRYILATRHFDNAFNEYIKSPVNYFYIEKFNTEQMQKFLVRFFPNKNRANDLIEALKENRILERLPITPMTISLISILYEEKNFEIPSTISDIYDNFNLLLLGKANVKNRFEFIDISFKERILSLYAFEIINKSNKTPLKKIDFFNFFDSYFKNKTSPVNNNKLEELLDFLITNTGVLFIDENEYVRFKHDSFMEYYAAIEIFKHKRDKEQLIIDNFSDANWQNVAIFYAGKSRDMPVFLKKIIKKVKTSTKLQSFFSNVAGIGYLLQALYQTDNILRKEAVLVALETNIKAYENFLSLVSDNKMISFKNLSIPFVAAINLMLFVENFNSITLKTPLELSFSELLDSYSKNNDTTEGFKALKVALTLNSNRINNDEALEKLIWNTNVLKNNTLAVIADLGTEMYKGDNYKKIKKEIKKRYKSLELSNLLTLPVKRAKYTKYDSIKSYKKIKLITEGKTDSEIIEYAYKILTNYNMPYWEIKSAGNSSGGAHELSKLLMSSKPIINEDEILIGIFDNDSKGIQEFNGLKSDVFVYYNNSKRIKKHKDRNIYALKLPIPPDKEHYLKKQQEMNFFCIEHYFNDELLNKHNMLKKTDIPQIYKINDNCKKKFSDTIRQLNNPNYFSNFIFLFKEIDRITNCEIDYNY